ncbi:MAG: hypothetical protein MZV63_49035 [Marinilabiliales bacterium]|nr:hypothetical protein [Marinilabiliales bacterium]
MVSTNFTMVVIVPEGTLTEFNATFDAEKWNTITSAFDNQEEFGELTVYMPKFKFSYEKYLNDQLQSMGMLDAFNPGTGQPVRNLRCFHLCQFRQAKYLRGG